MDNWSAVSRGGMSNYRGMGNYTTRYRKLRPRGIYGTSFRRNGSRQGGGRRCVYGDGDRGNNKSRSAVQVVNFVIQPIVVRIVVVMEGGRVLVSIAVMRLLLARGLLWELDLGEGRRESLVRKVG